MPKPKSKRAGRARRPVKGKAARGKARRPKPKAKAKRPKKPAPARKGKAVAPKKKKKVRAPAKPTRRARKPAMTVPRAAAAPRAAAPPVKRKEETRMAGQNCPIHNSPDCFKPALDAHVQKAYDGYCTKIDSPYWRIIPKGWKPGK